MASATKTDYSLSVNKRAVQNAIFDSLTHKYKKVIGLAGPNITDYLQMMKNRGFKSAEIYENDISQLAIQIDHFKPIIKAQINYGDIIQAKPNEPNTLYDLDFCCSINNAYKHIQKFSDDASITTLSIRPVGFMRTLLKFSQLIDSESSPVIEFLGSVNNNLGKYRTYGLTTGAKKYQCYLYKDTVPMVTIQSIIY
jgi:hypothetical protein